MLIFSIILCLVVFGFLNFQQRKAIKHSRFLFDNGIKTKAYISDKVILRYRKKSYYYIFYYNDSMYNDHFIALSDLNLNIGDSIDIFFLESNPRISKSTYDIYNDLKINKPQNIKTK